MIISKSTGIHVADATAKRDLCRCNEQLSSIKTRYKHKIESCSLTGGETFKRVHGGDILKVLENNNSKNWHQEILAFLPPY